MLARTCQTQVAELWLEHKKLYYVPLQTREHAWAGMSGTLFFGGARGALYVPRRWTLRPEITCSGTRHTWSQETKYDDGKEPKSFERSRLVWQHTRQERSGLQFFLSIFTNKKDKKKKKNLILLICLRIVDTSSCVRVCVCVCVCVCVRKKRQKGKREKEKEKERNIGVFLCFGKIGKNEKIKSW